MLFLKRKQGQHVLIGEDVRVVVAKIEGDIVTIGVDAPKKIPVHVVREALDAELVKKSKE